MRKLSAGRVIAGEVCRNASVDWGTGSDSTPPGHIATSLAMTLCD